MVTLFYRPWARPTRGARALALLAAACLLLSGCGAQRDAGGTAESGDSGAVSVRIDGATWDGASYPSSDGEDLRVFITRDGQPVIDLPFGEAHTVEIIQPGVGENTVELTGESVFMAHADCENQDCVQMGAVTRENLELRVLGGFIVCLPHRISVEVRAQ